MNKRVLQTKSSNVSEDQVIEYILKRFESVKESKKNCKLVEFQTMNKYMLMAHSQEKLKLLGNLVANHQKRDIEEILEEYEKHLMNALEKEPTKRSNLNVLMHIFGYFSRYFSKLEKELFFDLIKKYRDEKISLGKILSEIGSLIYRFDNTYLARQTYFLLYADTKPGILFAPFRVN